MKSYFQIVLFFILVLSCTSRTIYKKPDDLIGEKKMIDIWTDIYIAGAAKNFEIDSTERKVNYLPMVFEKYGIDSTRFSESNLYYTSKIEDYEKMLKKVNDRLQELKDSYHEETELDSVLKVNRERYRGVEAH